MTAIINKNFIWSISKFRDFEQCPRMCRKKHVEKAWVEAPNEAMERGKRVHKILEDSLKYDLELPAELNHVDPIVKGYVGMRAQGWSLYPEMKFGVSMGAKRVEFYDGEDLRVRCVLDVFLSDNNRILITDWKTGKYKGEHKEDAQFYGALTHVCFNAKETYVHYNYIDEPRSSFTDRAENISSNLKVWWKKFEYADRLILSDNAPATPCNACAWCGDKSCQFNKNKKLGN